MTRCAYVEARLRALADGELDGGEHSRVLAHLEGCAQCRASYARVQSVASLVQEQEPEEVPAHFSASLQVRLARHRQERAKALKRRAAFTPPWQWGRRWRVAGGLTTAAMLASACLLVLLQGPGAAEVARRAELSWSQIRNYGGVFVSQGVYRGQQRTFTQSQFFRRAGQFGEFRLETGQDYPLVTYVDADRVVHYLPGGDWQGKGPLVIIRPRGKSQDALPFPFGVTWNNGGNISLDQLIRQLSQNQDAELAGTEMVGNRECYRLKFAAVPPGGRDLDQYELWIDRDNFLPRRVSWYHDPENHIVTEAKDLQVNYEVLPAGTFEFRIPEGACVVQGDIDPHVLALPFQHRTPEEMRKDPVASASYEAWTRAHTMPFPVFAPDWLPEGYRLIRVRGRAGSWVDAHWMREDDSGNRILKLVEQDASVAPSEELLAGEKVNLGTEERPIVGRMVIGSTPYDHVYLTWRQSGTRCTMFAAGLPPAELKRMAGSMVRAAVPEPPLVGPKAPPHRRVAEGEPSTVPDPPEDTASIDGEPSSMEEPEPGFPQQPSMMPEMSDEDGAAVTPSASSR
jgi:outer membrane lipoprotein-sorting protein